MALVILGDLVISTALNLFVLPTLALGYGRFRAHREHELSLDRVNSPGPTSPIQELAERETADFEPG